ncbi:type IV secretion protein Rhs [Klebsiella aerogenes]|uniref:type IV secretion protein Rhs n=1 Tax=Klebsiella aerogenes TaxID=548 RepID=UPI000D3EC611|nr:type IV secretion protein Rhs [Klebsiella aerogenes]AWD01887.1 type IV secretion protein Rhs [Klebsiella aerogenes]MCA4050599.1 type IV secretion protein Rhs [Klebsiella aerogenes]
MPVNERINATSGTRIKPGGTRLITTGEIGLLRALYNYGIRYNTVWIHRESYLPFNLQPIDIAMSPNGEMWFREDTYSHDFSMEVDVQKKHRFMHELMHVWQAQHGMFVRTRGLFSRFADYSYSLDKENIRHYSLEQQASLVSDYWLLQAYGFKNYLYLPALRDYDHKESDYTLLQKYKLVMKGFPQ